MSQTPLRIVIWRQPGTWLTLAIVLVFIAAGFFTMALDSGSGHDIGLPLPTGESAPKVGVRELTTTAAKTVLQTARSVPVSIDIPAINVDTSLSHLGLNADHTVQVPTNFAQPGWYDLGPTPGEVGSAVILGHVDSYKGEAIFFRLRDLVQGDQIKVVLADGIVTNFRVNSISSYPKVAFPSQLVYAPHGYSALQLVTCGGIFDRHTGSYLSNIVVYSSLVSVLHPAPQVANSTT